MKRKPLTKEEESIEAQRRGLVLAVLMLLPSFVYANDKPIGVCRAVEGIYRDVAFNLNQFDTAKEAGLFELEHHGMITHETTGNKYYVTWAVGVIAPPTGYNCAHITED